MIDISAQNAYTLPLFDEGERADHDLFFLARAQGDHRVAVIVVAEYNFFYDAFEFLHSTSMGKPEASPS